MQRTKILFAGAVLCMIDIRAADVIANLDTAYKSLFGSSSNLLAHPFDGTLLLTWNRSVDGVLALTGEIGHGSQLSYYNRELMGLIQKLQVEMGPYITAENGLYIAEGKGVAANTIAMKFETAFNSALSIIKGIRAYTYTAPSEIKVSQLLQEICYTVTDSINELLSLVNLTRTNVKSIHGYIQGVKDLEIADRAKRIDKMKGLYYAAADTKLLDLNNALTTDVVPLVKRYGPWYKDDTLVVPIGSKERASDEAYLSAIKARIRQYSDTAIALATEKTSNTEFQAIRKELADLFYQIEQEIDRLLIALRSKN